MGDHWVLWALLSAAFAALTAVLSKVGLRGVDPDVALFVRTAVVLAAVGALATITHRGRDSSGLTGMSLMFLALAGLATAVSWACYFRALALGDAARVSVVDKLSVPLVALLAAFVLGERLGPVGWLGVLLAALGAVLVTLAK